MTKIFYNNDLNTARSIGWDRVPEYLHGDPSLPFVLHDSEKGTFTFRSTGNVELQSPYGELIVVLARGQPSIKIENGRKGFITPEGKVKFANHDTPVTVPVHWLREDT